MYCSKSLVGYFVYVRCVLGFDASCMLHLSSYYLIVYLGVRLVYYFEHVVITWYALDQRVILGEPCVSIIRKMLTTVSQPIRIVVQVS